MSNTPSPEKSARHVAIVMDGNGRWATARGLERLKGHARGVDRVREIVGVAPDHDIKYLTIFAFSTENWKRSAREVTGLMSLFRRYIRKEAETMMRDNVRVRFVGDRSKLGKKLRELMIDLEKQTLNNSNLNLTVALNYGGRDEITRAVRRMGNAIKAGGLNPEDITEDTITSYLDTADIPDPDLVIRTSGENRTSNFLPWQAAYAEYVFTPTAWPDFTEPELAKTLESYRDRDRRFGASLSK
ncbi:MAG: isoprenyl transferase [Rhodobacteraceae bacterium]|nr:isoprenyl transferase [Paracoccaceae bacterium]